MTPRQRIIDWIARRFGVARFDKVPFAEIPSNDSFWWRGNVYIKETEYIVFLRRPMPRPFPWMETVKVLRERRGALEDNIDEFIKGALRIHNP